MWFLMLQFQGDQWHEKPEIPEKPEEPEKVRKFHFKSGKNAWETWKPEKVRIFTLVRKKSVFFLQFTIKSKIFACGAELYLNNITMIKDCLNILNIIF